MGESVKKNYLYNLVSQILIVGIPVITTPYISRSLGAKAIGDFSYTTGIVSYFCIISMLGTANYAQREIAKKRKSKADVSQFFYEILCIRFLMTGIVLGIYTVFINLPFCSEYHKLYSLQIISFVSWCFDITWLYQGIEKFKTIAIRNIIIKLFATILIFTTVKEPNDLEIYTFIYCLSDLVGNATLWFRLRNHIQKHSYRANIRKHVRGIVELFIPNIAIQLYSVFDRTMLGTLVNTVEVGYYSQADKIIRISITAISSLFTVLLPKFAFLSATQDREKAEYYYKKSISYTLCLSLPMTVGSIMVSSFFVPVFLGKGYEDVIPLVQILSILFIIMSLEKLYGTILIAYERQNKYTISVSAAAIVNVILNAFFICAMHINTIGVAMASVIAETVAMGIQVAYLPKNFNKKTPLVSIRNYLKPTGVMMICVFLIQMIPLHPILQLLVDFLVGASVYFGTLLAMKDPLAMEILTVIAKKAKQKHA